LGNNDISNQHYVGISVGYKKVEFHCNVELIKAVSKTIGGEVCGASQRRDKTLGDRLSDSRFGEIKF
jgi:hypothetical protein